MKILIKVVFNCIYQFVIIVIKFKKKSVISKVSLYRLRKEQVDASWISHPNTHRPSIYSSVSTANETLRRNDFQKREM